MVRATNNKKISKNNFLINFILVLFILQSLLIVPAIVTAEETIESAVEIVEAENTSGEEGDSGEGLGDTLIDTGDGELDLGAENDINHNVTNVTPDETENIEEADVEESPNIMASTTVTNSNTAETSNDLEGTGSSGDNEIPGSDGDAEIDTGDIGIEATTDNDINNNSANIVCEADCSNPETASTTHEIEVYNTNVASTTNDVELNGDTGENVITKTDDAVISTGDIGIINVIINYINTNFFGSGREFFINIFNHVAENIDLSGYYSENSNNELGECEVGNCQVTVNNDNTSELENNIIIDANTGINVISSSSGASLIDTGDINIANDILNIANLNITGDGWFFAVVNIFGEFEGDVVLPGADEEDLEEQAEEVFNKTENNIMKSSELIVTNGNLAEVLNNIDINGNSGDNQISSSSEAFISTGDVNIETNTFNLINYNIFGNTWKFARVNIFGDWHGFIHGLPAGYSYLEDEYGITIYNDFLNDPAFYATYAQLAINNHNIATTTNNVDIDANTGENSILHGSDASSILTGDINVDNSILNFINANFTGNSWEFSMINVFGEWQGNLAFGQPELWITESISTTGPVGRGEYITYNFLFGNNGDGIAKNVQVYDDFDEKLVSIASDESKEKAGVGILWDIDQLPPNSQGSLSYVVEVNDDIPFGQQQAENIATIASLENDRDYSNNSSYGSVLIDGGTENAQGQNQSGGDSGNTSLSYGRTSLPSFAIVKTNDAEGIVRPGDIVNFQIIIKNIGQAVSTEVLVLDVMSNFETGEIINREFWNLETVYENEEIIIDYGLEINNNIKSGTYINEVTVEGYDVYRAMFITAVASTKIKVENDNYKESTLILDVENISKIEYANRGDDVLFNYLITNNSQITAYNAVFTESLPEGLTYSGEYGKISKTWELGDIKPGISKNIEYIISIDENSRLGEFKKFIEVSGNNYETKSILEIIEVRGIEVLGDSNEVAIPQEVEVIKLSKNIVEKIINQEEDIISEIKLPVVLDKFSLKPKIVKATEINEEKKNYFTPLEYGLRMLMLIIVLLVLLISIGYFNKKLTKR